MSKTTKQKIGEIGEDITCRFLIDREFEILDRNYWKKWGEIDVVAKKQNVLHFVEVKTVSCKDVENISRETNDYRPEDNIHPWKLKRLSRTIQTYLLEKNISDGTEWQFDVVVVFLDTETKTAKVRFLEDIIL